MADHTAIEWTEATWNPVTGCSVTSPGCTNRYALQLAGTRLAHHESRTGLTRETKSGPVWTGEVRFNEQWLDQPLRWRRPRMIFVCAHGDLFHEDVPDEWIDRVFAVMALCPQHTFQVLTKRSARMRSYVIALVRGDRSVVSAGKGLAKPGQIADALSKAGRRTRWATPCGPLPNVWLGVSVEDQQRADERIPDLLATPAAVRWLSCEPLLGPVEINFGSRLPNLGSDHTFSRDYDRSHAVSWVVAGGESGPGARPMHPDWARSLRDQCAAAGVPFFFKQWGHFAPGEVAGDYLDPERPAKGLSLFDGRWSECWSEVEGHADDEPDVYPLGKKRAGRLLDGVTHDAMPVRAV